MKMLIATFIALTSLTAFSQVIDPVELEIQSAQAAMAKLTKAHSESTGVQEIKQEIESKYGVRCEGSSSTIFPDISKQVKYSANCKGEKDLKLSIKSEFKFSKNEAEFAVKSYAIEL